MESHLLQHGSPKKKSRPAPRPGVSVPDWFDLPLLVPDSDPVLGRIQRKYMETMGGTMDQQMDDGRASGLASSGGFIVPKVSRLSPQKELRREDEEREKHAAMQQYAAKHKQGKWRKESNKLVLRPRKTTHGGSPVVLDALKHQRSRLRDRIWKDLTKYGLWRIGDNSSWGEERQQETIASIDETVEAIMTQLQHSTGDVGRGSAGNQAQEASETAMESATATESTSSVFLTAVPVVATSSEQQKPVDLMQTSITDVTGDLAVMPEDDIEDGEAEDDYSEEEEEEDDDDDVSAVLAGINRREIQAPGLKRRQRLKDLHVFVEKQLQKRLFRSWETIEIALGGSGDLTVNQIVKFLQNSDVKLSAVDAAKVQSILNSHIENQQTAKRKAEADAAAAAAAKVATEDAVATPVATSNPQPAAAAKLSYETFRKIFQPKDTQETARWKREFDREKVRLKQEKEVYERELAALEARVKKRLDESARQMVELLDNFHCDPLAIPWEDETQRLAMRDQLLRIIFSKPARRRLSQVSAAILAAASSVNSSSSSSAPVISISTSDVPDKLSVPQIRSALLQKYSRNGHFESIEVPVAAYLFHDLAADRIKVSVKALWKRREADLWPERQLIFQFRLKKAIFLEWKRFTKHADVLRKHVLRKFVAWAFWTRQLHRYYEFYRTCFWPFYVWKRHLQKMIIARGKSVFLRNVMITYVQLRNFRAWKAKHRQKCWYRKQIQRLRRKKARQVMRICWGAWLTRLRVGIQIHRLWKSHGHVLQRLHKGYMVKVTFVLWRYYTILKQDMAARQDKCFHAQFPPIGASKQRAAATVNGPKGLSGAASKSTYSPSHPPPQQTPARGVSWYAPQPANPSQSLSANRSASMYPPTGDTGSGLVDAEIDVFVGEDGDHDKDAENEEPVERAAEVRTLSRIMETNLAPKIKRKTKLYDLCLHLYLRYRERDRCAMTANIIVFRRMGRKMFQQFKAYISHRKKNRMATDLGAFRILHRRFRMWLAVSVYKHPLVKHNSSSFGQDKENRRSGTNEDDVDDETQTVLEQRVDAIQLDWKNDNEWRQQGLAALPIEAEKLRCDLLMIAEENIKRMERLEQLEMQLRENKRQEDIFLRKEAGATLKVRALLMQQAQQILRTRGHRLHDVMDRIFDSLIAQKRIQQLKSSFRGLRVVMMDRYTTTLCHRAQMRNWIRICRKFEFWDRNIDRFYQLRVKFHVFRTLLRHAVWKWKNESPGLSEKLQQRQKLMWKYDHYLDRHGLLTGLASASRVALTKYSPANTFHGVFLRWTQYTQLSKAYHQIVVLFQRKHELWQIHSVFQTLKTYLKAKYTVETRYQSVPFLLRQCIADLDALHCKIIALRAHLPTQKLKKQLRITQYQLQQAATGAPTLKQLFQTHEQEIRHRLFLESRVMFVAYNERRLHHYAERISPMFGAPVGRSFAYEKAPPYGSISEIVVMCGKKVDALSLVLKTNASVTVEGQLHGNPFGNREVFTLTRGEKLISIEGFASQTIYGLRFGTSTGRLSKWFGHIEKGTKFELRSDWGSVHGKREEIVGIHGYADPTSIHALGCVFRHTTLRNIFEGMWLQSPNKMAGGDLQASSGDATLSNPPSGSSDGVHQAAMQNQREDMSLCDRQFAYFLQVRMCDVLLAMKRAHRFALRVHRLAQQHPWALTKTRIVMGIMRWYFNSLTHGLVHNSEREEEGKRILQDGMNKRAAGERAVEEGMRMLAEVDTFRDEDKQLNIANLGVRKVTELKEMIDQAEHKIALGKRQIDDGQAEILQGRHILPHIPMTKRMMNAIRRMYKVVQTKDYIDQMDPELRAILLEGDSASMDTPTSIYDQL